MYSKNKKQKSVGGFCLDTLNKIISVLYVFMFVCFVYYLYINDVSEFYLFKKMISKISGLIIGFMNSIFSIVMLVCFLLILFYFIYVYVKKINNYIKCKLDDAILYRKSDVDSVIGKNYKIYKEMQDVLANADYLMKLDDKLKNKFEGFDSKIDKIERDINSKVDIDYLTKELAYDETLSSRMFESMGQYVDEKYVTTLFNDKVDRLIVELQKDHITKVFGGIKERMKEEIDSLQSRNKLNLTIGIALSGSSLLVLVVNVLFGSTANSFYPLLSSVLPKISLAVIAGGFSLFFLKLYREGLDEIKYYQNEFTSLEMLRLAYCESLRLNKFDFVENIIKEMYTLKFDSKYGCELVPEDINKNIKELVCDDTISFKDILNSFVGHLGSGFVKNNCNKNKSSYIKKSKRNLAKKVEKQQGV